MMERFWAFTALNVDEAFNPGLAFWAADGVGGWMYDGDAASVSGGCG
jgi:hypothetical protein